VPLLVLVASGWAAPSRDFVVDPAVRSEVVAFWHASYLPSEGYVDRVGWTGSYGSVGPGAEGQLAPAFIADVERRVNFVRALCGVPATVRFNGGTPVRIDEGDVHQPAPTTSKEAAVQRAALMVALAAPTNVSALSHDPPPTLSGWTPEAWNGSHNSTIARGLFGPGAIDAYFRENVSGTSGWNYSVGHRRWLLAVPVTEMATGDTPGDFDPGSGQITLPSNLVYVRPRSDELASATERFVAYPGAGHFPAPLNSPFWSLSFGAADFSGASVTMTDEGGAPVPVSIVSRQSGFAENAIVWQVPAAVADTVAAQDRTYHVTVDGIANAGAATHSWSVTLIDPNRLEVDLDVSGPATPLAGATSRYAFEPVAAATRVEAGAFLREPASWEEGAEDGESEWIVDGTEDSYPLRASVTQVAPGVAGEFFAAGSKAFHLSFPTIYDVATGGVPEQWFEIDRELLPSGGAEVRFELRRGYMTSASELRCEASIDGGISWQLLGDPIAGKGTPDSDFVTHARPLPVTSSPLRLRFRLVHPGGSGLYAEDSNPGYAKNAFIDRIRVSHCAGLRPGGTYDADADGFDFGPAQVGVPILGGQEWWLRIRPVIADSVFPWGPPRVVRPRGVLDLIGAAEPPLEGASYSFVPAPGADGYRFEVAAFSSAPWVEGAEVAPAPRVVDGTAGDYELLSGRSGYAASGARSFRLALPSGASEEVFEVERELRLGEAAELSFWTRRGKSKRHRLAAEISTDGGLTWLEVFGLEGRGFGSDASGTAQAVDLSGHAGESVRVRFVLRPDGGTPVHDASDSGIWVDEVSVSDAQEVGDYVVTELPAGASEVRLDAASAGGPLVAGVDYCLQLRPLSGGVPGAPGAEKWVVPTASGMGGFDGWLAYEHPLFSGDFEAVEGAGGLSNGLRYAFDLDEHATQVGGMQARVEDGMCVLSRPLAAMRGDVLYGAEASPDLAAWSSSGVTVTHEDGELRAETPWHGGRCFLRWRIERAP